jgi:hypothetical protein
MTIDIKKEVAGKSDIEALTIVVSVIGAMLERDYGASGDTMSTALGSIENGFSSEQESVLKRLGCDEARAIRHPRRFRLENRAVTIDESAEVYSALAKTDAQIKVSAAKLDIMLFSALWFVAPVSLFVSIIPFIILAYTRKVSGVMIVLMTLFMVISSLELYITNGLLLKSHDGGIATVLLLTYTVISFIFGYVTAKSKALKVALDSD